MIINREITPFLIRLAKQFGVVAIMGPRQSGKTTLVKNTFPDYAFVTLEDVDKRLLATEDPRGFLLSFAGHKGVIIDEVQEVPQLFSYMQGIIDQENKPGRFIITGSQNFLMHEKITQTLAGRIAMLTLLPLSVAEIKAANLLPRDVESLLLKGCYPKLHAQEIDVKVWCTSYISTYVEKDVRQLLKITDVLTFQRFLKLCAARIGNLINYAQLAQDCEISPHTAKDWMAVLEASYVIKMVTPFYKNFNKRVIKAPKLFFYDTGLVCSLLGIRTAEEIFNHPIKGALFESFAMSEFFKYNFNHIEQPSIYFWRDAQGHEIDCIIEKSVNCAVPIEIKAGKTISQDFFKGLLDWQKITGQEVGPGMFVVYGGNDTIEQAQKNVFAWHAIADMLKRIYG